jgi:DNA-binding transcriptional LysR family regulator
MLRKKELDFALCSSALVDTTDRSLATRHLFVDERLVVASSFHPFFTRENKSLPELLNDLWILPPPGFIMKWLAERFGEAGLSAPVPKIETTSTIQMINAIESQRFISVLPATAVRNQLNRGIFRPILPEHFSEVVDILAVHRAKPQLSRAAEHLLACIAAGEEGSNVVELGDFRSKKGRS